MYILYTYVYILEEHTQAVWTDVLRESVWESVTPTRVIASAGQLVI